MSVPISSTPLADCHSTAPNDLESVFQAIDRSHGRIEFGADRVVLAANDNYLATMGYTRDGIIGKPHRVFVSPEHARSEEYEAFWRVLLSGRFHRGEFQRVAKDGTPRWIQATYNPILDRAGNVQRIIKYAIDVTPQKLAQQEREELLTEMRRRETLLDGVLDTAPDAVIVIDATGLVVRANRSAEVTLGVGRDGLTGRRLSDFMPPAIAADHGRLVKNAVEHREYGLLQAARPVRCRRADGSLFEAELSVSKVDVAGTILFTGVLRDVTERVELYEKLLHAEKMESVGRLAAGIAHEINTPMQCISSSVGLLARKMMKKWLALDAAAKRVVALRPGDGAWGDALAELRSNLMTDAVGEDAEGALSDCRLGIDRVAEIVGAMKEFAHPGSDDGAPFDVNRCLRNAEVITRSATKQFAIVELDLGDCPPVNGSASALNQTFVNLIVNAADAIEAFTAERPGSGRITLSSRRVGDRVVVRVSDTGCGMPADVAEHAFEPFFTTKEVGKGSGQGLAIAYNAVVDKCGGTIRVDSAPGEGTTFTIDLPAAIATSEEAERSSTSLCPR